MADGRRAIVRHTLTYVVVSSVGIAGLQRVSLGPLERYGEVLSGAFVGLVGIYALLRS